MTDQTQPIEKKVVHEPQEMQLFFWCKYAHGFWPSGFYRTRAEATENSVYGEDEGYKLFSITLLKEDFLPQKKDD